MPAPKARSASAKTKVVNGRVVSAKSRTGSAACSQAMSDWVRTRKAGTTPASVYAQLGKCRSMARAGKQATQHRAAGNEAKAQRYEALAAGKKGPISAKDRLARAKELRAELNAKRAGAAPVAAKAAETSGSAKVKASSMDRLAAIKAKINKRGDSAYRDAKFYTAFGGPRAVESVVRFNRIVSHVPRVKDIEVRLKAGQSIAGKPSQPVQTLPAPAARKSMAGNRPASDRLKALNSAQKAGRTKLAKDIQRYRSQRAAARAAAAKYQDRPRDQFGNVVAQPGEKVYVPGQGMFGTAAFQEGVVRSGKGGKLMVEPGQVGGVFGGGGLRKAELLGSRPWSLADDPAKLKSRVDRERAGIRASVDSERDAVARTIRGSKQRLESAKYIRADRLKRKAESAKFDRGVKYGIHTPEGDLTPRVQGFMEKHDIGFVRASVMRMKEVRDERRAERAAKIAAPSPAAAPAVPRPSLKDQAAAHRAKAPAKPKSKPKPTKGTISVSDTTSNTGKSQVEGFVHGTFAAHPNMMGLKSWTVSHVGTGLRFSDANNKPTAVKAARILDKFGVNDKTQLGGGTKDARAAVRVANVLLKSQKFNRRLPLPARVSSTGKPAAARQGLAAKVENELRTGTGRFAPPAPTPTPAPIKAPVAAPGRRDRTGDADFTARVEMAKVERNARRQERNEAKAPPPKVDAAALRAQVAAKRAQRGMTDPERAARALEAKHNRALDRRTGIKESLAASQMPKPKTANDYRKIANANEQLGAKGKRGTPLRQEAAQAIRGLREKRLAAPSASGRIAEQKARAAVRERSKFSLFGGQTPNERPLTATSSPSRPSLRQQADAARAAKNRYGNAEAEAAYRKRTADTMKRHRPRGAQGISDEARRNYAAEDTANLQRIIGETQRFPKQMGTRSLTRKYANMASGIVAERAAAQTAKLAATRAIPRGTADRMRVAADAKEVKRQGLRTKEAVNVGRVAESIRSGVRSKDEVAAFIKDQTKLATKLRNSGERMGYKGETYYAERDKQNAEKAAKRAKLATLAKQLAAKKRAAARA